MGYGNRKDRTLVLEGLGDAWLEQRLVDYGFEMLVGIDVAVGIDAAGVVAVLDFDCLKPLAVAECWRAVLTQGRHIPNFRRGGKHRTRTEMMYGFFYVNKAYKIIYAVRQMENIFRQGVSKQDKQRQ